MSSITFLQYLDRDRHRALAISRDGVAHQLIGFDSMYALASFAAEHDRSLTELDLRTGSLVDINAALKERRLLAPIDHPEPARMYITGTGLTHLGSATGRDAMHRNIDQESEISDSMKMFLMGVQGGKPGPGEEGAQPEWFYKGNGSCVVAPEWPLPSPSFALDGGEEPEIAGIYLIGADGTPLRVGFCLANEFSDHITERSNYLWLAHSKLRPIALGPELLSGSLPQDISGTSRILRNGKVLWEKPFLSGEHNMSHSIANLEHHHFKYDLFRRPGDVHVHVFGTATLSFSDGVQTREGDLFEIEAEPFRLPLRNPLARSHSRAPEVRAL